MSDEWHQGIPTPVTEKHLKLPWSGNPKNFRCHLCGHRFVVGDTFRMVFTNGMKTATGERRAGGNPLVCEVCDGPDEEVRDRWDELRREWQGGVEGRFWTFARNERAVGEQEYANERAREERREREDGS